MINRIQAKEKPNKPGYRDVVVFWNDTSIGTLEIADSQVTELIIELIGDKEISNVTEELGDVGQD